MTDIEKEIIHKLCFYQNGSELQEDAYGKKTLKEALIFLKQNGVNIYDEEPLPGNPFMMDFLTRLDWYFANNYWKKLLHEDVLSEKVL